MTTELPGAFGLPDPFQPEPFRGAKLAILTRGRVVTLLRDDRPDIVWPGHWDLPGGGREGTESPEACVLRELEEELSLRLTPADLHWRGRSRPMDGSPGLSWFFVSVLDGLDEGALRLGDEGQRFALMPVAEFLTHPLAVPALTERLGLFLNGGRPAKS